MAGRTLHCCSASSTNSSATTATSNSSAEKPPLHPLTTTSIKQIHDLENSCLLTSDPQHTDWCDAYSLDSLKLTLDHVIQDCKLPRQQVLVEFPFSQYLTALNTANKPFPISPSRAQTHIDQRRLAAKKKELRSLIKFYKKRIQWVSVDSRLHFGLVAGNRVAVIAETSKNMVELNNGEIFREFQTALKPLIEDQLANKEMVYFISFANSPSPRNPKGLPFTKFQAQCIKCANEWISSLKVEDGCNLLDALKLVLHLKNIDTILLILSTQPNQPLDIISSYMVDALSGENAPKLHLVSFNAAQEIQTSFSALATECHGHLHSYTSQSSSTDHQDNTCFVEDSDINHIKEEIIKAQKILCDMESLKHGVLDDSLIGILRELSLSTEWEEDDDFPLQSPPAGDHCLVCTSPKWILNHGIESQKLNLYKYLAPDAYPQLQDHVDVTDTTVASEVYDVMPLIPWPDGSLKYLHVDVHRLESYLSAMENFILSNLQNRLSWLTSGSRVPFGQLIEAKVLLVVDSSHAVMSQILVLQQHFRMLLEEQLAHVKEFNLIGCGSECRLWTTGFAEPNRLSLLQAWEWILGISPAGSTDLLSALKLIFESDNIFEEAEEVDGENVGIYLVISAMPDQMKDVLCSYIEQVICGRRIHIHVIHYDTEPCKEPSVNAPSLSDGGRCGTEEEVVDCLKALSVAGKGRFHHFKVSGTCDGDDITELMEEIDKAIEYLDTGKEILDNYREFCRRNVPVPEPKSSPSSTQERKHHEAPPLYPRQTTSSLARMNTCLLKLDADEKASQSPSPGKRKQIYIKNHYLYTGRGLNKVNAWDLINGTSPRKVKLKPLIPSREEYISSKQWLSLYGMESLSLDFCNLYPKDIKNSESNSTSLSLKGSIYRHINHQGEVIELRVNPKELKAYASKLQTVLSRYQARIQWLNKEQNKYFGVVTERKVVFLLDVSSSMTAYLEEIKEGLTTLLNHLPPKTKSFNLIAYSTSVLKWSEILMPASKDSVCLAVEWLKDLKASGNSYLLEALRESLKSGATGIYLVSDGTADHTHEFLLNQLTELRSKYGTEWKINTAGWHCSNKSLSFMENLAHSTEGRFHFYPCTSKADDHKLLAKEVELVQIALTQTQNFL